MVAVVPANEAKERAPAVLGGVRKAAALLARLKKQRLPRQRRTRIVLYERPEDDVAAEARGESMFVPEDNLSDALYTRLEAVTNDFRARRRDLVLPPDRFTHLISKRQKNLCDLCGGGVGEAPGIVEVEPGLRAALAEEYGAGAAVGEDGSSDAASSVESYSSGGELPGKDGALYHLSHLGATCGPCYALAAGRTKGVVVRSLLEGTGRGEATADAARLHARAGFMMLAPATIRHFGIDVGPLECVAKWEEAQNACYLCGGGRDAACFRLRVDAPHDGEGAALVLVCVACSRLSMRVGSARGALCAVAAFSAGIGVDTALRQEIEWKQDTRQWNTYRSCLADDEGKATPLFWKVKRDRARLISGQALYEKQFAPCANGESACALSEDGARALYGARRAPRMRVEKKNANEPWHVDNVKLTCRACERRDEGACGMFTSYISYMRESVERREKEWGLERDAYEALRELDCVYCGRPPSVMRGNGIDRVNNGGGYVQGNCVACCMTCNGLKGDRALDEFLTHASLVASQKHWISDVV